MRISWAINIAVLWPTLSISILVSSMTLSSVTLRYVHFLFLHTDWSLTHCTSCYLTSVGSILSTHEFFHLAFHWRQSRNIFEHLCLLCSWQCCNFHFWPIALERKPSFTLPKFLTHRSFCFCIKPFLCLVSNLCSVLPCTASLLFPAFFT